MSDRMYSLEEVIDRIGLDYTGSGKMDCPFCGKKRKLNLCFEKNAWRCPVCGSSGYAINFFARYVLNTDLGPYSSRSEKERVKKELHSFMGDTSCVPKRLPPPKPKAPPKPKVQVAPDDMLDAAYQAMAKIPALQLLPEHRQNLLNRGLSEDAIVRNGYRSIPSQMVTDPIYTKLYKEEGGESRRTATMGWLTANQICFGMMIAHSVISQGISVQGVPGFFLFGKQWCYWCNPGILIPTRNINGQIVIWQIRRDKLQRKDDPRYRTVSCKDFPGHVTESVSRCHFPLANAPIDGQAPFCLTEGPLKADIAVHLYGAPVAFAAVPGIQTTTDFYACIESLQRSAGIDMIYNCLDMDRLTNLNVRRGALALKEGLAARHIHFEDMYWGVQYASSKLTALTLVAKIRKVHIDKTGSNVFDCLQDVAIALENAGVNACTYIDKKGDRVKSYWDPSTKGIDDYLLNCK